ncbi:unnamed protein product [Gongylonema pulchrum]|uniref:Secreted protein n=1 Tax=Gongylonema pulchrum TaxID=637853 RepID=A0A183ERH0_9BILA|nr:unnamed protein product [Gongylonema pulchrum]
MLHTTAISLLLSIVYARISGEENVSALLLTNTNAHNPGIYMRLMPTGLAYLREIGMKVVNDEILRIQLPTITEVIEAGQVLFPVTS